MGPAPSLPHDATLASEESAAWTSMRRLGYFLNGLINGLLIWVAHNLLDWEILPFLTDSFNDALPAITVSLALSVIASGLRIIYPAQWFVDVTEVVLLAVGFYATVVLWRVFPFDFSDSGIPWDLVAHVLLILAIVGMAIGMVSQIVKTLRHLTT